MSTSSRMTWRSESTSSVRNAGLQTMSERMSRREVEVVAEQPHVEGRVLLRREGVHVAADGVDRLGDRPRAAALGLPLKSRCSRKCEIPACASVSSRDPVPTQKPTHAERTSTMRSVTSCTPAGSVEISVVGRSSVARDRPAGRDQRRGPPRRRGPRLDRGCPHAAGLLPGPRSPKSAAIVASNSSSNETRLIPSAGWPEPGSERGPRSSGRSRRAGRGASSPKAARRLARLPIGSPSSPTRASETFPCGSMSSHDDRRPPGRARERPRPGRRACRRRAARCGAGRPVRAGC